MNNADMKNGPHFEMWVIGIAAGLVAGAVMYVVGEYGFMAAAFVGALVALVVGAMFGLPQAKVGPLPPTAEEKADAEAAAAAMVPAASAKPAAAKPAPVVAEAVTEKPAVAEVAPAAFVAMPAAEPKPAKTPRAAKPAAAKPAKAPAAAKPAKDAAVAAPAKAPKAKKETGPKRLTGPRKGIADDLKEIEGIGPAMEKLVNGMGFYHFDQIASWSDADVALVDSEMKTFKGRIVRDKWVAQAKIIVAEGLDAFRERAKTNNY
jgi:predicted flap endonuclease-1-like 5' DNA nuclease